MTHATSAQLSFYTSLEGHPSSCMSSLSSFINPGPLAYTESASDIYHLHFQQQPGQLEPYSPEGGHFCVGSFLYVSMFTNIIK